MSTRPAGRRRALALVTAALLIAAAGGPASALTISFDYSHDTFGFFTAHAEARALLDQAATAYNGFADSLSAITPSGTNHWTASFIEPSVGIDPVTHTTVTTTAVDPSVPANTLVVYVGGSSTLPAGVLGYGGPGGYSYNLVTQSFADAVSKRGQAGATNSPSTSTDFGPWGGAISFSSTANWFFSPTVAGISGSQSDFLSVAIHELGHVLGIGTANSFKHDVSGTSFVGPNAEASYGGPVPLLPPSGTNPGLDHWAEGTASRINGQRAQETEMDPTLTGGTRKIFTDLDYAGMSDVGWQVRKPGDANVDGKITADDFALLDRGFQKHLAGWNNGDFNADGSINSADYLILDRAYFSQTGTYEPTLLAEHETLFGPAYAADLLADVPEPGLLTLGGIAALAVLRRR